LTAVKRFTLKLTHYRVDGARSTTADSMIVKTFLARWLNGFHDHGVRRSAAVIAAPLFAPPPRGTTPSTAHGVLM
jgi:hypothetical protein